MKRARFTEEQIIGVLNEHEAGAKAADLARKTAGLLHCRCGSHDDPLPLMSAAGHGTSHAVARPRRRAEAFWLSLGLTVIALQSP